MKFKICSLSILMVILTACGGNGSGFVDENELSEVPIVEVAEENPLPEATETLPPPIVVASAEPEVEEDEDVEEDDNNEVAEAEEMEEETEVEVEEAEPEEPETEEVEESELEEADDEDDEDEMEVEDVPLTILSPKPDDQITIGQPFQITGLVTPGDTTPVQVTLRAGASQLAAATLIANEDGNLVGDLDIPYSIEGEALLIATLADEEVEVEVTLARDSEAAVPGALIDLDEPVTGTILVSGYMIFLEGRVLDPIDNTLTLGVLMDDCSDFVSRQPITIAATAGAWSTWNAQIILPRELQGEGCLVAYTGEYGVDDWRETRIPVLVVNEEDDRVNRVEIIDSFEGVLAQGDRLYVSGLAIDTDEVELNLLRDGEEEIASALVPVDNFGFWEVEFQIPAENAVGQMELEAVIPDADEEEEAADSFEFEVR